MNKKDFYWLLDNPGRKLSEEVQDYIKWLKQNIETIEANPSLQESNH